MFKGILVFCLIMASLSANARLVKEYVYTSKKEVITVNANDFSFDGSRKVEKTLGLELQKELIIYEEYEETTLIPEYDVSCSESGGNGKSDFWNRYYSAKKGQKAKLLEEIKGVGSGTSEALNKKIIQTKKPRSWNDFIKILAEVNRQAVNNVQSHADENREILGYESKIVCQDGVRYKSFTELMYREKDREIISTQMIEIDFSIDAPILLKGEKETFQVSLIVESGLIQPLVEVTSAYNNYEISYEQGAAYVRHVGIKKRRVRAKDIKVVLVRDEDMQLSIEVDVNPTLAEILKREGAHLRINGAFQINKTLLDKEMKKYSFKVYEKSSRKSDVYTMEIRKNLFGNSKKEDYIYDYSVSLVGSRYYNSNYSTSDKETNEVPNH